jgi:hypothetical protein
MAGPFENGLAGQSLDPVWFSDGFPDGMAMGLSGDSVVISFLRPIMTPKAAAICFSSDWPSSAATWLYSHRNAVPLGNALMSAAAE